MQDKLRSVFRASSCCGDTTIAMFGVPNKPQHSVREARTVLNWYFDRMVLWHCFVLRWRVQLRAHNRFSTVQTTSVFIRPTFANNATCKPNFHTVYTE
eukprot:1495021-Amphidinium_carterae.2